MFTGNTLSLDEISERFGITTLRDCRFAFVGKVPTRLNSRVVPCKKLEHINLAVSSEGVVGIVTTHQLASAVPSSLGLAVSGDPVLSTLLLQDHIALLPEFQWKSFTSRIHPSASVAEGAYISSHDVEIGEGCVIHPGAVVLPRSIIDPHCTIGAGTIVGADAFEVNKLVSPQRIVTQSGGVRLAAHVEVQSKCTLVRSTFGGFSELGDETKLDCQVHIAHDCRIGKRVSIAACAEVSGRVDIGDDCFIGPNASISNGINIGARSSVTIGAVVTRDVPSDSKVSGNFAIEHQKWLGFMRSVR